MLKLLLRSLKAPLASSRWRKFISETYRSVGAAPPKANVFVKPIRSYLFCDISPRARTKYLMTHYALIRNFLSDIKLLRLLEGSKVGLKEISGRNGARFVLELQSSLNTLTDREGELVISLREVHQEYLLCWLTFLFVRDSRGVSLLIGGLQGAKGRKHEVVAATRALCGLRPKDAVLLATRALAQAAGAETRAIATNAQIFRERQGVSKFADHDEYWRERGAVRLNPQEFVFGPLAQIQAPATLREKTKQAIISDVSAFAYANLYCTPRNLKTPACKSQPLSRPDRLKTVDGF